VKENARTVTETAEAMIVVDGTMEQSEEEKEVENVHGTEIEAEGTSDVVVEIVVENVEETATFSTIEEVVVVEAADDEATVIVKKEREVLHRQRSDSQHLI